MKFCFDLTDRRRTLDDFQSSFGAVFVYLFQVFSMQPEHKLLISASTLQMHWCAEVFGMPICVQGDLPRSLVERYLSQDEFVFGFLCYDPRTRLTSPLYHNRGLAVARAKLRPAHQFRRDSE